MNNAKKVALAALCLGAVISQRANAYESGDWVIRAGLAHVHPDADSTPLVLNGTELSQLGLGLPVSTIDVESDRQLGLTVSYFLNNQWAIGLLASTPFSHDIQANGLGLKAGKTKHLPPTFSLQYFPMAPDSTVQPYVGLGLNYTRFFEEEVSDELNAALSGLGATDGATMSLDASTGIAMEIGVDYEMHDNVSINAALWYLDIDTNATIRTPGLGDITSNISIDPFTFMLSLVFQY